MAVGPEPEPNVIVVSNHCPCPMLALMPSAIPQRMRIGRTFLL
jgi:hypothetical protein